jgi:hypothetical protein
VREARALSCCARERASRSVGQLKRYATPLAIIDAVVDERLPLYEVMCRDDTAACDCALGLGATSSPSCRSVSAACTCACAVCVRTAVVTRAQHNLDVRIRFVRWIVGEDGARWLGGGERCVVARACVRAWQQRISPTEMMTAVAAVERDARQSYLQVWRCVQTPKHILCVNVEMRRRQFALRSEADVVRAGAVPTGAAAATSSVARDDNDDTDNSDGDADEPAGDSASTDASESAAFELLLRMPLSSLTHERITSLEVRVSR